MIEEKSLLLMNVRALNSKQKKKIPPVCLYIRTSILGRRYHNFRRSERIQIGKCFLCVKCRFGIEIQSKIMIPILILNRILILIKTL